jgi:Legume lectin domain
VAVKFDIFNNGGEGNNSTGLYTGGKSPNVPATNLGGGTCTATAPCPSPTTFAAGIPNLHSGDIFQVHMVYDGTNLTMTITDTAVPTNTYTIAFPINIPTTVKANTAYAGFTAATGSTTALQQILTWTYAN